MWKCFFLKCTTFYDTNGMGANHISTDSGLRCCLSKTLFGDNIFIGEFWKDDLFGDVGYDEIYSDKTSERYHKSKRLRKQELNTSHWLEFFPSLPSNLMDSIYMSSEGKKEKKGKHFKSKFA